MSRPKPNSARAAPSASPPPPAVTRPPVLLIPAFRAGSALPKLVNALRSRTTIDIVIVDDGSGSEFDATFESIESTEGVTVLHHASNKGKGAALKTGLAWIKEHLSPIPPVVTADADGQHLPADIERVIAALRSNPTALILGTRAFDARTPWASRAGNTATRWILHRIHGQNLSDTQTGLRGIPAELGRQLQVLPSDGYAFESEMLLLAHQDHTPVLEVPIATVYLDGNRSSHFKPIADSITVGWVLLRLPIAIAASMVVDLAVFLALTTKSASVLEGQLAGRSAALAFLGLFHSQRPASNFKRPSTFIRCLLVFGIASAFSLGLMIALQAVGLPTVTRAKILAETLILPVTFLVIRQVIYPRS